MNEDADDRVSSGHVDQRPEYQDNHHLLQHSATNRDAGSDSDREQLGTTERQHRAAHASTTISPGDEEEGSDGPLSYLHTNRMVSKLIHGADQMGESGLMAGYAGSPTHQQQQHRHTPFGGSHNGAIGSPSQSQSPSPASNLMGGGASNSSYAPAHHLQQQHQQNYYNPHPHYQQQQFEGNSYYGQEMSHGMNPMYGGGPNGGYQQQQQQHQQQMAGNGFPAPPIPPMSQPTPPPPAAVNSPIHMVHGPGSNSSSPGPPRYSPFAQATAQPPYQHSPSSTPSPIHHQFQQQQQHQQYGMGNGGGKPMYGNMLMMKQREELAELQQQQQQGYGNMSPYGGSHGAWNVPPSHGSPLAGQGQTQQQMQPMAPPQGSGGDYGSPGMASTPPAAPKKRGRKKKGNKDEDSTTVVPPPMSNTPNSNW